MNTRFDRHIRVTFVANTSLVALLGFMTIANEASAAQSTDSVEATKLQGDFNGDGIGDNIIGSPDGSVGAWSASSLIARLA